MYKKFLVLASTAKVLGVFLLLAANGGSCSLLEPHLDPHKIVANIGANSGFIQKGGCGWTSADSHNVGRIKKNVGPMTEIDHYDVTHADVRSVAAQAHLDLRTTALILLDQGREGEIHVRHRWMEKCNKSKKPATWKSCWPMLEALQGKLDDPYEWTCLNRHRLWGNAGRHELGL